MPLIFKDDPFTLSWISCDLRRTPVARWHSSRIPDSILVRIEEISGAFPGAVGSLLITQQDNSPKLAAAYYYRFGPGVGRGLFSNDERIADVLSGRDCEWKVAEPKSEAEINELNKKRSADCLS